MWPTSNICCVNISNAHFYIVQRSNFAQFSIVDVIQAPHQQEMVRGKER
jgi:hypothetical protein